MAQIVYSRRAFQELQRIIDFLLEKEPGVAKRAARRIREAVSILEQHPLIGREVEEGLRELVISRGRTGFVALYRWLEREEVLLVLSLRHQREAG